MSNSMSTDTDNDMPYVSHHGVHMYLQCGCIYIYIIIINIIKLYYRLAVTHMRRQIGQLSKLQTLHKDTTLLTTGIIYSYSVLHYYYITSPGMNTRYKLPG